MKAFAALYRELDASTSSLAKQAALQRYLREAPAEDAAWAVYFLAGGKPRQLVPSQLLQLLAREAAGLPQWLFDECYDAVGDLAETIALLLPPPTDAHDLGLATWVEQLLLPLRDLGKAAPDQLADRLRAQWRQLATEERLVYFKLITGAFRVGVSRLQVTQALAAVGGIDAKRVAQRLMGYTHIGARPGGAAYRALIASESADEQNARTSGQPYPFFLAHPLALPLEQFDAALGPPADWIVEWKWDGIRAQLVKRAGQVWLWSRGEELVTDRFPELAALGQALPDGTRARRRDRGLARRSGAALCRAAKTHRPQDDRCEVAARAAGRAAGLRPARMGRPRRCGACRRPTGARCSTSWWRACSIRRCCRARCSPVTRGPGWRASAKRRARSASRA